MGYHYSAIHNTILHDGKDDDDIIDDGQRLRVPLTLMDSMQRSIAQMDVCEYDNVKLVSRQELADWDKAQLSARWKGGLQTGDRVRIGDRNLVVSGSNPENGKVVLADASTSATDAEARQSAYDAYDADVSSRYLTRDAVAGESCSTAGREPGRWREKNGRLVCVPDDKSSKEFALAGPLSDAERVQIKGQMYADYDSEVSERWRK